MPAYARATRLPDLLLAADLIDAAESRANDVIELSARMREAESVAGLAAVAGVQDEYGSAIQRLGHDKIRALADLEAACRDLCAAEMGDRVNGILLRVASQAPSPAGVREAPR
jgi:hypothetical protein